MKKIVVCILLDALRWDYLNDVDTPFLWNRCIQGMYVKHLETTFAFSQARAIFAGSKKLDFESSVLFPLDANNSTFSFLHGDHRVIKFSKEKHWWEFFRVFPGGSNLSRHFDRRFQQAKLRFRQEVIERARNKTPHAFIANIPLLALDQLRLNYSNKKNL